MKQVATNWYDLADGQLWDENVGLAIILTWSYSIYNLLVGNELPVLSVLSLQLASQVQRLQHARTRMVGLTILS